jgi:hypothetical protein
MIFKTEFKIAPDVVLRRKSVNERIEYKKELAANELGNTIASEIGFEELPDEGKRFRLEIQASSFREWELLKEKIINIVPVSMLPSLQKLFSDFESGKKSLYATENKDQ